MALQVKDMRHTLLWVGNPREALVLGCLWIAAKIEDNRKLLPTASKLASLVGTTASTMNAIEIDVLELLQWDPLKDWVGHAALEDDFITLF